MNYEQFLARVINDGIEGAKEDYQDHKLEGAIAGFEACRSKTPAELAALLGEASQQVQELFGGDLKDYWRAVCYRGEVEWVCNCVSAMLANDGHSPIVIPTARGVLNTARILRTVST
jgi:hypothetical protein